MRNTVRTSALTLAFLGLFVAALVGQAFVGHAAFDQEQELSGAETVGFAEYVTGPDFAVDVAENWQSEYLQFFLLITASVWLVQRGSPESKPVGNEGRGTDGEQRVGRFATAGSPMWARVGGWRGAWYARSLGLTMLLLFVGSWTAQFFAGWAAYNEQRADAGFPRWSWWEYLSGPEFWDRSLQNWQSEFLAVASMVLFSVFLRERGSPESKPVGAPHALHDVE